MISRTIFELVNSLVNVELDRPKYSLEIADVELEPVKDLKPVALPKPSRTYSTVVALDASTATIHVGGGELAISSGCIVLRNAFVYPSPKEVQEGPPFIGAPLNTGCDWVTDRYVKLGVRYIDDPDLPEGALAHDVRISLETFLIGKVLDLAGVGNPYTLVLIDGPVEYPIKHPKEGSSWNAEIARLNDDRVSAMRDLVHGGFIPVSIVKRVWGSRYLTRNSDIHYLTDVQLVESIIELGEPLRRPSYVGPWIVRWEGTERVIYYIVNPLSRFTKMYSLFRVEFLRDSHEVAGRLVDDILSVIAYSAGSYGITVPYKIYLADYISKRTVSELARFSQYVMMLKGLPTLYGGVTIE